MIEVSRLTKSLFAAGRRVDILKGIDLTVPRGQFLAVTGASGSGKTTFLSLLAGLDAPTSGVIKIDGQDISRLNEDELAALRGRRFGFIFQNFHLIPTLTALENVMLARELNGANRAEEHSKTMLVEVGLEHRLLHYPSQLSGGEQQRLSLARAFVNEPDIILADEPTGNLDSKNSEHVLDLVSHLHQEKKATIVMVTHEAHVAARTERVLTMEDGKVVEDKLNESCKP